MTHYIDNFNIESHGSVSSLIMPPLNIPITLNGSYQLLPESPSSIVLTGNAAGFSILLPDCTLETHQGHLHVIYNTTNSLINVKNAAGVLLFVLSQNAVAYGYLKIVGTIAGEWIWWQTLISGIASGLTNYNLVSATPFSTSSQTDVAITGFTLTPQAGTYAIFYNASVYYTTTPKSHWWSIYKSGVQITDSERRQDTAHSNQTMVDSTMTITAVDGTQAIDVRVRCANTGVLTVNSRSLLIQRLGS